MELTSKEKRVYNQIINNVVPTLIPGKVYLPKELFINRPCNPRIVRHLREKITAKEVPLVLVKSRISEGITLQLS